MNRKSITKNEYRFLIDLGAGDDFNWNKARDCHCEEYKAFLDWLDGVDLIEDSSEVYYKIKQLKQEKY
jgi:hypothetical protein